MPNWQESYLGGPCLTFSGLHHSAVLSNEIDDIKRDLGASNAFRSASFMLIQHETAWIAEQHLILVSAEVWTNATT